jgi:hypothetical protein
MRFPGVVEGGTFETSSRGAQNGWQLKKRWAGWSCMEAPCKIVYIHKASHVLCTLEYCAAVAAFVLPRHLYRVYCGLSNTLQPSDSSSLAA